MNDHVTRFSDSSLYDEICVNCGATDNMGNLGQPDNITSTSCSSPKDPYENIEQYYKDRRKN